VHIRLGRDLRLSCLFIVFTWNPPSHRRKKRVPWLDQRAPFSFAVILFPMVGPCGILPISALLQGWQTALRLLPCQLLSQIGGLNNCRMALAELAGSLQLTHYQLNYPWYLSLDFRREFHAHLKGPWFHPDDLRLRDLAYQSCQANDL
jgi:hypothetical protein